MFCYIKGVTESFQTNWTLIAPGFRTCVSDMSIQCVLQSIPVKEKEKEKLIKYPGGMYTFAER